MTKRILIATKNKGKVSEIRSLLQESGVEILSLDDFPDFVMPPEEEPDFEGNAMTKARSAALATGIPALADDSGLEVDYLDKRPGIYSARYSGKCATDEANNAKLLKELSGVPMENRGARYVCALAYVEPGREPAVFEGECEGIIAEEPKGSGGFGYDPLFYVPTLKRTMAELSPAEKGSISHRGKALLNFVKWFLSKA